MLLCRPSPPSANSMLAWTESALLQLEMRHTQAERRVEPHLFIDNGGSNDETMAVCGLHCSKHEGRLRRHSINDKSAHEWACDQTLTPWFMRCGMGTQNLTLNQERKLKLA